MWSNESRFYDSMSDTQRTAVQGLRGMGLTLYPTGSRMICPADARSDSDWDLVCQIKTTDPTILEQHGWSLHEGSGDSGSFYHDGINLICFTVPEPVVKWRNATDLCVRLVALGVKLCRRARVEIFKELCDR